VLAEHYNPSSTAAGWPPSRWRRSPSTGPPVAFHLVRGPVRHVAVEFTLTEHDGATRLEYSGELGTDFGIAGQW
jgi:hypothetical protein